MSIRLKIMSNLYKLGISLNRKLYTQSTPKLGTFRLISLKNVRNLMIFYTFLEIPQFEFVRLRLLQLRVK